MTGHPHVVISHGHAVAFYDHDADVFWEIDRFVGTGLAQGERVVVIPTASHRGAVERVRRRWSAEAVDGGIRDRLVTLDAEETLGDFLVAGSPDAQRFVAVVGALIDAANDEGRSVRVFGEMVALLWAAGDALGAVQLEQLWSRLAETRRFSLLCAYPTAALGAGSLEDVTRVCETHSMVVPPRSYSAEPPAHDLQTAGAHRSSVFVPLPAAVPAARRFVSAALSAWGDEALLTDAALVTAELATNAIAHAGSAFRVDVRHDGRVVRISVEDAAQTWPASRGDASAEFSGRGVAVLHRLARRWGCDVLPSGKTVWAELDEPQEWRRTHAWERAGGVTAGEPPRPSDHSAERGAADD